MTLPCFQCHHEATEHVVDDEERRECTKCGCEQFVMTFTARSSHTRWLHAENERLRTALADITHAACLLSEEVDSFMRASGCRAHSRAPRVFRAAAAGDKLAEVIVNDLIGEATP